MFSRPEGISDQDVVSALHAGWGLEGATATYAPVGFGSHHWWVSCGDGRRFATADDLRARREDDAEPESAVALRLAAALGGARALRDAGLEFVVAPLPQRDGELLRPLGDHHLLALYPFVDGAAGSWGPYPDRESRAAVVDRVCALHSVAPGSCPGVLPDGFALPHRRGLGEALAGLSDPWQGGPYAEPARALLTAHAGPLVEALEAYDRLVTAVRARARAFTPTHGEPHPGNTVVTDGGVVLVDWDTLLLAPPERDLWSLAVEEPAVLDRYRSRTGRRPDPDALALYRLRWDLTEVCLYVDGFRRPHEPTADTRTAWEALQHQFAPWRR